MDANQKINKKIHYCWLSEEPFPDLVLECMATWKAVLPDYEIVRWDMESFDVNSVNFVREACEKRKWAFASDYIRLFAVYSQGGIYLDTDVKVFRKLDDFLAYPMFIPMEFHKHLANDKETLKTLDENYRPRHKQDYIPGIGLQAAMFGAREGHLFLKECMKFYEDRNFINPDGTLLIDPIAPGIYAKTAEDIGFRYRDEYQSLEGGTHIIESKYFASSLSSLTSDAFAVHCCAGSWRDKVPLTKRIVGRLKRSLSLR